MMRFSTKTTGTSKSCPCDFYEERLAIMLYDGELPEKLALTLARRDVCTGCSEYDGEDEDVTDFLQ